MFLLIIKILLMLLALFIVLTLGYTLFAPMSLFIHTERQEFGMKLGVLFEGKLIWDLNDSGPFLEVRFPFIRQRIYILSWTESQKPDGKVAHRKRNEVDKKKSGKKHVLPIKRVIAVVKSCKIREFQWNLDTDDFCLNAQLFPIFYLASLRGNQVNVNFCGKNNLDLVIENRLYNVILHFIKPINQKTWMQRFIRIF
jgi:hypothetical protein